MVSRFYAFCVIFLSFLSSCTVFSAENKNICLPRVKVGEDGILHILENGNWLDLRREVENDNRQVIRDLGKDIERRCGGLLGLDVHGQNVAHVPETLKMCDRLEVLGFANQQCSFLPDLNILGCILTKLQNLRVLALDCSCINQCELDKVLDQSLNKDFFNYFCFSVSKEMASEQNPIIFNMPKMLMRQTFKKLDFYGSGNVDKGFGAYCLPGHVALNVRIAFLERSANAEELEIVCPSGKTTLWDDIQKSLMAIYETFQNSFAFELGDKCNDETLDDLVSNFRELYGFQVVLPAR
ncbi:hypothetical protein KAU11_06005 [Candidatus Babeliales bacterium]|nr:hypothetical protein [Candidatus Babeliales bacterium]